MTEPLDVAARTSPPAPSTQARRDARRPVHVVVAIGLSTTAYALSLAAVTSLQVTGDQDLIAERAPVEEAISMLAAHHDEMSIAIERVRTGYRSANTGYEALTDRLDDLRARLDDLGSTVDDVEHAAGILPSSLDLPIVPKPPAVRPAPTPRPAAPPAVHATTGASGAP